jgi:hypothetical protein
MCQSLLSVPLRCLPLLAVVAIYPKVALADVFTVGQGGTYMQLQDAVNAALAHPGDDEIRIKGDTSFSGQSVSITQFANERLDISGGWNSTFDQQQINPYGTSLNATMEGRTLRVDAFAGVVTVRNLALIYGHEVVAANAYLVSHGSARIEMSDCSIAYALADGGTALVANGAGASLAAFDESSIVLERCRIRFNTITGSYGVGAGLDASVLGTARIRIADVEVSDNILQVSSGSAGGMSLRSMDSGVLELDGVEVSGNRIIGDSTSWHSGSGVMVALTAPGKSYGQVLMRRLRVTGNTSTGNLGIPYQVDLSSASNNVIVLGDSEVSRSATDGGVYARRNDEAQVALVNLTIPDNAGFDLEVSGEDVQVSNTLADSVHNSIALATVTNSLFGVDPHYVDRDSGFYELLPISPAIGAGASTPPGGLGILDLGGNPRILGMAVDIGAHEFDDPEIFRNGFEDAAP